MNSVVAIFWDGRCKFKKIGGPIASLYEEPSNSIEKNKGRCAHVHELKLIEEKKPKNFEGKEGEPSTVLHLVKEDVSLRFRACGGVAPLMYVKYLS